MEATKTKPSPVTGQVTAKWGDGSDLDQVFVDELLIHLVKERVYITFGQLKMPLVGPETSQAVAEVVPMARVIITRDSLQKMLDVLNKLVDENPPGKSV